MRRELNLPVPAVPVPAGMKLTCYDPDLDARVRRPWRGRGMAKVLLTASMRAFQNCGLERAGLMVDTENPSGALRLYEGLGYRAAQRSQTWARDL